MVDGQDFADPVEERRRFWATRCEGCRIGIQQVMETLGVSRDAAVTLFAAMLVDNSANLWHAATTNLDGLATRLADALEQHDALQREMMPSFRKLADEAERQRREAKPPWEDHG